MTKLNQILAISKGVKNDADRVVTDLYHALDKKALFDGLSRTYEPLDENGDQLPPEFVQPQLKAEHIIGIATDALTRLFDVQVTLDVANTLAKADVVVDDVVIAANLPVTYLLFLEKQIEHLAAFVKRLPALDPAQQWTYDPARGVYVTPPSGQMKTKKVPRNHVLAEATKEHPAQVQMFHEDINVGTWTKVQFSGGLPADQITAIAKRLEKLRTAVKFAREAANAIEVTDRAVGERVLRYLFHGQTP